MTAKGHWAGSWRKGSERQIWRASKIYWDRRITSWSRKKSGKENVNSELNFVYWPVCFTYFCLFILRFLQEENIKFLEKCVVLAEKSSQNSERVSGVSMRIVQTLCPSEIPYEVHRAKRVPTHSTWESNWRYEDQSQVIWWLGFWPQPT